MFRSSISFHLTKFWLDRIGGCWVLVVAFRLWSWIGGWLWWWVSFDVCWIHLVVGFGACWISLVVRFGACWVCLVAGFRDGLFGSRVLVVAGFYSRWWWSCLWVLFGCLVIFSLGFWWVRYWVWVWIARQWAVWFLGLWCMLIYGFVGLWCMLFESKSTTHLEKISNP